MTNTREITDLQSFLKRFSPIPNAFIDDLFTLYGTSTSQADHVIDLDAISKWLTIKKSNLMATLKQSYKDGIDYVINRHYIEKGKGRTKGGHNKMQVLLTPDCFKRLSMRSKGKKAEEVRTYFIQIESLVLKYKDHMMAGMIQEIKRLERNQSGTKTNSSSKRKGYIYVIRASEHKDSVYKIGRTINLSRRLREHQAALADDLDVIFTYQTDDVEEVEGCIKASIRRKRFRKYKEVYQIDIDVLKSVIEGCNGIQKNMLKREYEAHSPGRMKGGFYACVIKDTGGV
jgi:phage anti-repressor protein/predicted GIY-YIG superfamily endonuclease